MSNAATTGLKHFTRGGQVALHAVRMFGQIIAKIVLFFIISMAVSISLLWYKNTDAYDRELTFAYAKSAFYMGLSSGE